MKQYDVIVLGAGPAGVAAAVAAARTGAKTLLVEQSAFPGGMSTAGLLSTWCGTCSGGIFKELLDTQTRYFAWRKVFDPELLKQKYRQLLDDAGAETLYHAAFFRAHTEGTHLRAIDVLALGQVHTLTASVFIDASGNGCLAQQCGVPYRLGRESDGKMQPLSLMFLVGGLTEDAIFPGFGTHPGLEEKMQEYVSQGKVEAPAGHVILIPGYHPSTATVNMTNVTGVDGTDVFALNRAEALTRRQLPQIVQFLRECVPGYENCYLLQSGSYVGVRESRHFEGLYTLTAEDILQQRIFDDWVVSNARYTFGNHSLTGSGLDKNNLTYRGQQYTIPLRSLLPKNVDNLLLAGRNISGTHMAHASFRVIPICLGIGEAAGTAAALAAKSGILPRAVPAGEIQHLLLENGCEPPEKAVLSD